MRNSLFYSKEDDTTSGSTTATSNATVSVSSMSQTEPNISNFKHDNKCLSQFPANILKLGQGQFSSVYLYNNNSNSDKDETVVIHLFSDISKIVSEKDYIDYFRTDAVMSLSCDHANINKIFEVDISKGIVAVESAFCSLENVLYKSNGASKYFQTTSKMKNTQYIKT